MSFTHKRIDLEFSLGKGAFGESDKKDTVKVTGLRVIAQIEEPGGEYSGQAFVRVYGLSLSLMNQLSGLSEAVMGIKKNGLAIFAGDDSGMSLVFEGQVTLSQIDMNAAPEVALVVVANASLWERIKPATPSSYSGSADVAVVMEDLAKKMGLGFENGGVKGVILSCPYFPGTLGEQARSCAEHAGINWVIDRGVLAIWPKGGVRKGAAVVVNPKKGLGNLVGYPTYSSSQIGIGAHTLYNPNITFGRLVKIEDSQLQVANGEWSVICVTHELASEVPHGPWFTHFQANSTNPDKLFKDAQQ